jgi:holo-ACP synthase
MHEALFAGPEVGLDAVLCAREARVERRREAVSRLGAPVVTVSPVMPGPVKDCPASRRLQQAALDALENLFRERRWPAIPVWAEMAPTGPEALIGVEADPFELKRALVGLETSHSLGRLWDLDVTDPGYGALSRRRLGLPVRRCFVCDEPAHVCARSRAHPLDELLGAIKGIFNAAPSEPSAARA